MKLRNFLLLSAGCALVANCATIAGTSPQESSALEAVVKTAEEVAVKTADIEPKPVYTEDWESLSKKDQAPAWFQDAKLGIYAHWGPVSKANEGFKGGAGWYGYQMYQDQVYDWKTGKPPIDKKTGKPRTGSSAAYKHHKKAFGDPKTVGYKEVIEQFDPSAFDPAEWAELFKASGARFAGPVAMHHDNFAMWDSEVTRWNVKDHKGIDVTGDLKREIEKLDMKFIASFHHAFTWVYYANAYKFDATAEDADLYTDQHDLNDFKVTQRFLDEWYAKLKEVVDKYEPDVVWFDWWVEELPEADRKKFLAYYFNKGVEWGKEVVVSYKNTSFPAETGVHDYERGRPNRMKDDFWMTDTSPGAWFFRQNAKFVDDNEIIDILIDIVSKNGLMLLNVPPDPDGSIPPEMQSLLRNMGAWLEINGEGIYGTRPWTVFGEGPTRIRSGGHKVEKQKIAYTDKDIRFTKKGDSELFMFVMAKPETDIVVGSLGQNLAILEDGIVKIEMIGSDQEVEWEHNASNLTISKPDSVPSDLAVGYKITLGTNTEIGIGGDDDPGN